MSGRCGGGSLSANRDLGNTPLKVQWDGGLSSILQMNYRGQEIKDGMRSAPWYSWG